MNSSGENEIWTPPRLRARLAARKGLAPAPSCFIVWRATTRTNGTEVSGYQLPGDPDRRDEAAFEQWLVERNLAGADRLSVSVLVIREQIDASGLVTEGVLERRRGGVDGPCYGDIARVEFTGPAKLVRRYRAAPDGRLTEVPPDDATGVALTGVDIDPEGFAGEDAAVYEFLGSGAMIVDRRAPSLFEDLLGLSAVIHARRRNGTVVGCGVGWHGGTAFVVAADFARHGGPPEPPEELEAAVESAVRTRGLIRYETRQDDQGFCVVARERGRRNLVTIRLEGKATRIDPYMPGRNAAANDDQRRWMTYAETYEARTILDSWRHGDGGDIAVLTVDPDLEAWRHVIDPDGVEVSRQSDNETAAAALYRERFGPPENPPAPAPNAPAAAPAPAAAAVDESDDIPDGSLLSKILAWAGATEALGAMRADPSAGGLEPRLHALIALLRPLNVPFTVSFLRRLAGRIEAGTVPAPTVAAALEVAASHLREELAAIRVPAAAPAARDPDEDAPFGAAVAAHFPRAAHDIEEALRCLALRRSTACVLHAMRIVGHGLDSLGNLLDLSGLADLGWTPLLDSVRATGEGQRDLARALERVRRAWRAPGLLPAATYTEEEAETVLDTVEAFMRLLAARLDRAAA